MWRINCVERGGVWLLGMTYIIISDDDHGDDLLMARWKVVREDRHPTRP